MEELSIKEVITAVQSSLSADGGQRTVQGVSIDSRTVKEGDLFVAIKGQKIDSHSFVESVLQNGAVAAIVERGHVRRPSSPYGNGRRTADKIIEVEDTVKALGDLAKYYREKFTVPVIGITGSNGKTTTKELTAKCLEQTKCPVLKTERSLNSLIGLPLTLFNLSNKYNYCVLEIGTNQPGEIARLTEIAKPEIGVITNIGPTHLQNFENEEGVFKEKIRLLDNVKIGILNSDDPMLSKIKGQKSNLKIFTFGTKNGCDLKAEKIRKSDKGIQFHIRDISGEPVAFYLPLIGSYQVYNALAAISVGIQYGVELKELVDVLKNVEPLPHRDVILDTIPQGGSGRICIIDSSYNANPASMKLAIEELQNIKSRRKTQRGTDKDTERHGGPRLIAVLGDMLELGAKGPEEHLEIGQFLDKTGIDVVVGIGNLAKFYINGSDLERYYFKEIESAKAFLKEFIREGDIILVKSSRAIGLEKIVEELSQ